jgi:ABC-type nickel/cobalt efflux system permease component RcnA
MGPDDLAASLTSIVLGLGLGAQHALEPDHLAAIGVLAAEAPGARRTALLGAVWGIGHSAALLLVGLALAALSTQMPDRLANALELGVSSMLILLGGRAVVRAARSARLGPAVPHAHGAIGHAHNGPRDHVHVGRFVLSRRPLLVGMVHGLAGSGALTALVLAELPGATARLGFMTLFGIGSVVGMAAVSGLVGWPLAWVLRRPVAARIVAASAGASCAIVGVLWGIPPLQRFLA